VQPSTSLVNSTGEEEEDMQKANDLVFFLPVV
jgi:hypothetical protein